MPHTRFPEAALLRLNSYPRETYCQTDATPLSVLFLQQHPAWNDRFASGSLLESSLGRRLQWLKTDMSMVK